MKKKKHRQRKLRKKELEKKVKPAPKGCKYRMTKWGLLPFL